MQSKYLIILSALVLTACATAPRYDWVKPGATQDDKLTAMSECQYQIKLNKTNAESQNELLSLCLQGKGFRRKQVD